ncbi:MAG: hypothetical protein CVU95_07195 [Firmicutes bacterium HGW-Firmicutes-2]|jgi:xanthine dehydrogenase accessory factor|nr:MAG: hypothetical protein CVU95_07195 [Firmicutes bacterium HGW-Firmicutes-2]
MDIYDEIIKMKQTNEPCMTVTVVEKTGDGPVELGKKMLVGGTGKRVGTVGGGALENRAIETCKDLIKARKSHLEKYLLKEGEIIGQTTTLPMTCGGVVTLFYEYIGHGAHIYIFGAGHVSQALCHVLKTMNFYVTVVDNRQEVVDQFVGGDEVHHHDFVDFIETQGLTKDAYVVVCTPSHKYDYQVMHKIIEKQLELKYVGMLCSKNKLKDYLKRTYDKFGENLDLSNHYAPTGIDTGGGSPAEIAVSISAEILAVYYNKTGNKHMRDAYITKEK